MRMRLSWAVLTLCFAGIQHVAAEPKFEDRERELVRLAPTEAFAGVGAWTVDDRYVATGHSISIDSLGVAKGKRTERELAEDDTRSRIAREAAHAQEPLFDDESHDVSATMTNFQTAATYRLPNRDGVFLIGIVDRKAVQVRVKFDAVKARRNALSAFEAADFSRAARLFSQLTQHDIQDQDTISFAGAASAHVNLAARVVGEEHTKSLKTLSDFYFSRGDSEQALRFAYDLYRETETPERALLERLSELSSRTHRPNSEAAFRKEISRRWPSPVLR